MSGPRVRTLLLVALLGALVTTLVRALRGEPTPAFSRHPSVDGGHRPEATTPLLGAHAVAVSVASPAEAGPLVAETTLEVAPEPPAAEIQAGDPPATEPHAPVELPGLVLRPDDPTVAAPAGTDLVATTPAPTGPRSWVEPVDRTCPDGYPVKAKLKSGIFHVPGGLAYDRTFPDRCYPSAEAAEADGLRAAKR